MTSNPYQVLGVDKDATKDEIKKAYRRAAKKYHPDLHPDDPEAAKKMNEVNEAYDMLMNPEKYTARQGSQYSGQAGGYGGYAGNGYYYTNVDFEDIFGFAFGGSPRPQARPDDSDAVKQAIYAINANKYSDAASILNSIPEQSRNGRWYYLSALAHHGLGNTVTATEHITRAMQMEPGNRAYSMLYQQISRSGQTYNQNAGGFNVYSTNLDKICMGLCLAQFCCPFCRCC